MTADGARAEPGAPATPAMTVAIDSRGLTAAVDTGVGRYLRSLLHALARQQGIRVRTPPSGPRLIGPHLFAPLQMRRADVDVWHGPANGVPLVRFGIPTVVTMHDLAIYEHPEWFPEHQWLSTRVLVPSAARAARVIICPSEATRRAVIGHLGANPERCRVIPHGVDAAFSAAIQPVQLEAVRAHLGLPATYWLQVGTVQPRKNYLTTLRALARIPAADRLPLVIVGSLGWKYEPVMRAIDDLRLSTSVRFIGSIAMDELPAVYRMAAALAFPSLDEGFGLPILEAFASGVPVVTARRGAMIEVAQDAALLIEPEDEAALAEALVSLRRDHALADRLREVAHRRAASFTWDASASAHVDAYRVAAAA